MQRKVIKYGGAVTGLEEERAIIRSIKKSRRTANWQQAEEGALFEKELAAYVGTKHAILTSSGSCAGLLALSALDLPPGAEVIIPAVTFPTIFNIIIQCGLTPVVVDSKIGTYNLAPNELEAAITPKTKAIIAVHALGNPVNMPRVMEIAKKHKLYVIEDNCDGLGGRIGDRPLGSFGTLAITSLHAAHIVSMGVGGAVFTDNAELAKKVRMYRDWGRQADINESKNTKYKSLPKDYNPRFIYEKIGYNFQVLELQAAMGRVQLRKIEQTKKLRRRNFAFLFSKLQRFDDLVMPTYIGNPCWFAFPLSTKRERGPLLRHLEAHGIETRPMFAGDITKHPAYKKSKYGYMKPLKDAQWILKHSFWISCHPRLSARDLRYIIKVFKQYYENNTNK